MLLLLHFHIYTRKEKEKKKRERRGTCLAVQSLRLCFPVQGEWVQSLVENLGPACYRVRSKTWKSKKLIKRLKGINLECSPLPGWAISHQWFLRCGPHNSCSSFPWDLLEMQMLLTQGTGPAICVFPPGKSECGVSWGSRAIAPSLCISTLSFLLLLFSC